MMKVRWSKKYHDLLFDWDSNEGGASLVHYLSYVFCSLCTKYKHYDPKRGILWPPEEEPGTTLFNELDRMGYDLTTFKFSIEKKK
jgi:hypothetical protein